MSEDKPVFHVADFSIEHACKRIRRWFNRKYNMKSPYYLYMDIEDGIIDEDYFNDAVSIYLYNRDIKEKVGEIIFNCAFDQLGGYSLICQKIDINDNINKFVRKGETDE